MAAWPHVLRIAALISLAGVIVFLVALTWRLVFTGHRMAPSRRKLLIGVLLSTMGGLFVVVAIGWAASVRPWKWSRHFGAEQVTGRVVGFTLIREGGDVTNLPDGVDQRPILGPHTRVGVHPRVRYEVGGKVYECRGVDNTGYRIGDVLTVRYPPGDPADGNPQGFFEQYAFFLVFGGVGTVFLLAGQSLIRHPDRWRETSG